MAKKLVERKKDSCIVNILKKFVKATTITKHILDLSVNLIVGKLLVSVSSIKKQFTKAISKDKAIQFSVNTLKSSKSLKAKKPYF